MAKMNKFKHHYYNSILKEADSKNGVLSGDVYITGQFIRELPEFFKDIKVYGIFDVSRNLLTSLKNFPYSVNGFSVSHNKLTSLEGIPSTFNNVKYNEISARFDYNNISSCEEFYNITNENFHHLYINDNPIESLKGLENKTISITMNASRTKLKNLKYCPNVGAHGVSYIFYNCEIESLEGCPVGLHNLNISENKIKSLKHLQPVNGPLRVYGNTPNITYSDVSSYLYSTFPGDDTYYNILAGLLAL